MRNALIVAERRKRLDIAQTTRILSQLARLPIVTDPAQADHAATDFARRHRLTVYDAAYLELASRRGLALATLDRDLRAAAVAERVPLLASA